MKAQWTAPRIVREGFWVLTGQTLSALGLLLGIRLQTEFISPNIFGKTALVLACSAFAIGVLASPYLQAALRFFPEAVLNGVVNQLRAIVLRIIAIRTIVAVALVIVGGIIGGKVIGVSLWTILLLCALIVSDVVRTTNLAFLNAAREQRIHAMWSAFEAWSRPLMAVVGVFFFGETAENVLSGYVGASLIGIAIFGRPLVLQFVQVCRSSISAESIDTCAIRSYARPLFPMAIVGWISSLSDRFIIASLLSLREAGVYAAIYGLVSRPFLLAHNVIELTTRPAYFGAVADGDVGKERVIYRWWIGGTILAGVVLVVICIMGQGLIARYLLGERYASSTSLIPYIAIGHLFLIVAYTYNAYLYAHKLTAHVLVFSAIGAAFSVVTVGLGAWLFGLSGVAVACAVYYCLQMVFVMVFVLFHSKRGVRVESPRDTSRDPPNDDMARSK